MMAARHAVGGRRGTLRARDCSLSESEEPLGDESAEVRIGGEDDSAAGGASTPVETMHTPASSPLFMKVRSPSKNSVSPRGRL